MVRKKSVMKEEPIRPQLVVSRAEARAKIEERIRKGKIYKEPEINNPDRLGQAWQMLEKWYKFNLELLETLFIPGSFSIEYKRSQIHPRFVNPSFDEECNRFFDSLNSQIACLESIIERLELFPELNETSHQNEVDGFPIIGNDVFIVHGRSSEIKQTVARFLEKLGLKPIILHEQPSEGKTIIEKFESHAAKAGFAVILMTSDDQGGLIDASEMKPRARQNVIFELGYFIGKLGRNRVCPLYLDGVELPSDYDGVVYILFDKSGGWMLPLAKELKQAGYTIDINKAI